MKNKGAPPRFGNIEWSGGAVFVECEDSFTKKWITETVRGWGNLWKGAKLFIVEAKERIERTAINIMLPNTKMDMSSVLTLLIWQNPEVDTSSWRPWSRTPVRTGVRLTLGVSKEGVKSLDAIGGFTFRNWNGESHTARSESIFKRDLCCVKYFVLQSFNFFVFWLKIM